jgi:hypothetical protein
LFSPVAASFGRLFGPASSATSGKLWKPVKASSDPGPKEAFHFVWLMKKPLRIAEAVPSVEISRDVNGDGIRFSDAKITPYAVLQTKGAQKQLGELSPEQQVVVRQVIHGLPRPDVRTVVNEMIDSANTGDENPQIRVHTLTKTTLDMNGSKIELANSGLTPDIVVELNGKQERFENLPRAQQQALVIQKSIPQVSMDGVALAPGEDGIKGRPFKTFQVQVIDIMHDGQDGKP